MERKPNAESEVTRCRFSLCCNRCMRGRRIRAKGEGAGVGNHLSADQSTGEFIGSFVQVGLYLLCLLLILLIAAYRVKNRMPELAVRKILGQEIRTIAASCVCGKSGGADGILLSVFCGSCCVQFEYAKKHLADGGK